MTRDALAVYLGIIVLIVVGGVVGDLLRSLSVESALLILGAVASLLVALFIESQRR